MKCQSHRILIDQLFCLKVLPLVSFHFKDSSSLNYWYSAHCPGADSQPDISRARLPSSSTFWNWCSSSCVGQEGLCWNANPSCRFCSFFIKKKETQQNGLLHSFLCINILKSGKQFTWLISKEKLEEYAVAWVILKNRFKIFSLQILFLKKYIHSDGKRSYYQHQ